MPSINILRHRVQKDHYTLSKPFVFITQAEGTYGGRVIPKGSHCKFFETTNRGFIAWTEPTGAKHLASDKD